MHAGCPEHQVFRSRPRRWRRGKRQRLRQLEDQILQIQLLRQDVDKNRRSWDLG